MHNDSVSAAVSTQDTAICVHSGHSNVSDTGLSSLPCPWTQSRNAQQQLREWKWYSLDCTISISFLYYSLGCTTVHLEHNASKPVERGLNGTGARDSNLKWDNGTRGTMVKDAQGK